MTARLTTDKTSPSQPLLDRPVIDLVYLVFVFLPLVFWPQHPWSAVWASLAAIAVFVPLFFAFHRDPPRRRWALFVVAGLGFALIPFNPGGNTFVIYAAAMSGIVLRPRNAILLTLAMLAAMAAEYAIVLPTRALAAGYTLMIVVIALLALTSVLYARERERRNVELRLSQDEIARLAAMAERERIGRDLHDLLGHTLSVIALKSELAGRLLERDVAAAKMQIGEVESVARQALAQVREAVVGIRATGLQAELAAARLALLSAEVRLDQRLAPVAIAAAAESVLALALREAVTNVLRHAHASRVEVELLPLDGGLRLSIADDGRGGVQRNGNGLDGMRERIEAVGGRLEIDSPAGAGTRLQLTLPPSALALPGDIDPAPEAPASAPEPASTAAAGARGAP